MVVNGNRNINQNGDVFCDLNAVVYAMNCGVDITYIQLNEDDEFERIKFNENCRKFGLETRMVKQNNSHEDNHQLWVYDPFYDKINLETYFISKCSTEVQKERVLYELSLYEEYNMTKLLRCMIWLVDYMTKNKIFWGIGRGSSVSSYCLYLIGIHKIDSIKYDLDINEFLKWE